MKRPFWLNALAFAAALGTAAAAADAQNRKAAPARKAAAARDWTRTVVQTPEGGFRMGNPAAPVKVVEYGSLTCPGCAKFSTTASAPLAAKVRTGKVSFEFRNFVLNGVDLTAAILARCAGPQGFFQLTESFYANQKQWVSKFMGAAQDQQRQINELPEAQRLGRVADISGLSQLAAAGGLPAARAKACLADTGAMTRLAEMHGAASALGVKGTPSFSVNGALVHAHDWGELQPHIAKAGG